MIVGCAYLVARHIITLSGICKRQCAKQCLPDWVRIITVVVYVCVGIERLGKIS